MNNFRKTRISCMASAKRTSGRIVVVRDHHAHDPNSGLASSKLAKLEIKNNAMSTNLTPRELLFDAKTKSDPSLSIWQDRLMR
uniref:Uncharacterized protein n=1 Tax=Caenorhabditis japonica TaxID=281687 RepID=A0A8R1E6V3_CAEJA